MTKDCFIKVFFIDNKNITQSIQILDETVDFSINIYCISFLQNMQDPLQTNRCGKLDAGLFTKDEILITT